MEVGAVPIGREFIQFGSGPIEDRCLVGCAARDATEAGPESGFLQASPLTRGLYYYVHNSVFVGAGFQLFGAAGTLPIYSAYQTMQSLSRLRGTPAGA